MTFSESRLNIPRDSFAEIPLLTTFSKQLYRGTLVFCRILLQSLLPWCCLHLDKWSLMNTCQQRAFAGDWLLEGTLMNSGNYKGKIRKGAEGEGQKRQEDTRGWDSSEVTCVRAGVCVWACACYFCHLLPPLRQKPNKLLYEKKYNKFRTLGPWIIISRSLKFLLNSLAWSHYDYTPKPYQLSYKDAGHKNSFLGNSYFWSTQRSWSLLEQITGHPCDGIRAAINSLHLVTLGRWDCVLFRFPPFYLYFLHCSARNFPMKWASFLPHPVSRPCLWWVGRRLSWFP